MLLAIFKVIAAVIVLLYGVICLYLGVTRQGEGIPMVNMILVPAVFAILIFASDTFEAFVMENWEACFMLILMGFVASGIVASIYELVVIPCLIDGVGLITIAMWLSGFFAQETVVRIIELVGKGCSIFMIPFFIIVVFIYSFIR